MLLATIPFLVLGSAATTPEPVEVSAYYVGLSGIHPSDAVYTFMLDQILEQRCGKRQSLNTLKAGLRSSQFEVQAALNKGDVVAARAAIASLTCER